MTQPQGPQAPPALLRDQARARHAYDSVRAVLTSEPGLRKDYKIAIQGLGAHILRSGLSAAMAALERRETASTLVLAHLAGAGIPGLRGVTADGLPRAIRSLAVDDYMLATREMLLVVTWLKRAVQALLGEA